MKKQGKSYLSHGLKIVKDSDDLKTDGNDTSNQTVQSDKNVPSHQNAQSDMPLTKIDRFAIIQRQMMGRKTYRNASLKGRQLFNEPGLLGSGVQSCVDCHQSGKLLQKIKNYPQWDEKLSEVITFDRKLRYCIYKKMKGKPLSTETPVTVALTVYLNEVRKGTLK